jgi:hypothetical protein
MERKEARLLKNGKHRRQVWRSASARAPAPAGAPHGPRCNGNCGRVRRCPSRRAGRVDRRSRVFGRLRRRGLAQARRRSASREGFGRRRVGGKPRRLRPQAGVTTAVGAVALPAHCSVPGIGAAEPHGRQALAIERPVLICPAQPLAAIGVREKRCTVDFSVSAGLSTEHRMARGPFSPARLDSFVGRLLMAMSRRALARPRGAPVGAARQLQMAPWSGPWTHWRQTPRYAGRCGHQLLTQATAGRTAGSGHLSSLPHGHTARAARAGRGLRPQKKP